MAFTLKVRDAIRLRASGHCERCGVSVVDRPASIHHRRPRGMGGSKSHEWETPECGVVLCGTGTTGCHGYVESHRTEAAEQGWLVPRRDPRHPRDVPVFADGVWYLVTPFQLQVQDYNPPF